MKTNHLLLIALLAVVPAIASQPEDTADATTQAEFAELPEADEMGDAFRAFDDDLKSYEGVCDTIPIEENPRWKIWGAYVASAIYGNSIAIKKMFLRFYYAWKKQFSRTMRILARHASVAKRR